MANEWISADEGDMQRPFFVEKVEHTLNELVSFEVGEFAKLGLSAEMSGVEGIAAGAPQRTFFGDFDR
jgi:hypothetical protein